MRLLAPVPVAAAFRGLSNQLLPGVRKRIDCKAGALGNPEHFIALNGVMLWKDKQFALVRR